MQCSKILITIILLTVNVFAWGQIITEDEYSLIESVLNRAGLDIEDLNFEKDWTGDTEFKINGIVDILNEPLRMPRFGDDVKALIGDENTKGLVTYLTNFILSDHTHSDDNIDYSEYFDNYFRENVNRPKDLIKYGEHLFKLTEEYYQKAMLKLTNDDKEALKYFSYVLWADTGDQQRYIEELDFFEQYHTIHSQKTLTDYENIIKRINWESFLQANMLFLSGSESLKRNITSINFNNRRKIERNTSWGRFIVGTTQDSFYDKAENNIAFLIEPAGNNKYNNDFRADFDNPFYLFMDLSGNNVWRNNNIGGLFNVLGGIGWSADLSGNNIYEGDDLSFCSFVGFQYHYSGDGDDYYNTGRYSQGAATFGVSLIINQSGNNIYRNTGYGQGFGGTLGVGILIDYAGNDVYYSGGKYYHTPSRPSDYRTMGQGFGYGVRPKWGGGIGILYDGEGSDTYTGSVYAQGVSYWYALGFLFDRGEGNDTFRADIYSQGAGVHFAGGLLYNESGNNSYYTDRIGIGCAHDYSIAFFVDRDGNDHYSVDGGAGVGWTNSVGIFLDVNGNDRYERNRFRNYGYANKTRDSGGIGIFLDTGGRDVYPDTLWSNNDFWTYGTYGIGLDTTFVATKKEVAEDVAIEDKYAYIDTMTVVPDIFSIAARWATDEGYHSVERVMRARDRILEFEEEAARFIFDNKLNTTQSLELIAISDFSQRSTIFSDYLHKVFNDSDSVTVKNCIFLLSQLQDDTIFEKLKNYLEQNTYVMTIISALGNYDSIEAVEILGTFISHPSERMRFITARSLKRINTDESRNQLTKMLDDESFLVRAVAKIELSEDK